VFACLVGAAQAAGDLQSLSQDPKQWPMAPRDYANTRYSALNEINAENVGQLSLAWSFSLGADRGQEAAPLVIDGTMYVVGPYWGVHPNQVFALYAATGDVKWSYAPKPNPAAKGVACCDVITRGLAYDNGKVFLATLDNYLVSIDAKTGQEQWHTKLGDIGNGETITMAPGSFILPRLVLSLSDGWSRARGGAPRWRGGPPYRRFCCA
jgi:glucose dehydrogenase